MNRYSKQKATSSVEKDFCKLLDNSNFGIDCQNNIDNCVFEPIYDKIGKMNGKISQTFKFKISLKNMLYCSGVQDSKNAICFDS